MWGAFNTHFGNWGCPPCTLNISSACWAIPEACTHPDHTLDWGASRIDRFQARNNFPKMFELFQTCCSTCTSFAWGTQLPGCHRSPSAWGCTCGFHCNRVSVTKRPCTSDAQVRQVSHIVFSTELTKKQWLLFDLTCTHAPSTVLDQYSCIDAPRWPGKV